MAMLYGLLLAQALILTTRFTRSGRSLAAARLNIPPILAPTSVTFFPSPTSSSTSLHCARTISPNVTIGKRVAHRAPLLLSMLLGPVEPKQPPSTLVHTTKYLLVSRALPGPMNFSHHPGFGLRRLEAAWEEA